MRFTKSITFLLTFLLTFFTFSFRPSPPPFEVPNHWRASEAPLGLFLLREHLHGQFNRAQMCLTQIASSAGLTSTPHTKMQGRRQADGAMISRALRGKCPLSFYNQGKGATRKSPRGRTAIRAAPPCCPCLVPCAFPLLPPLRGRA